MLPWKWDKFKLIITYNLHKLPGRKATCFCWYLRVFITPSDRAGSRPEPWIDTDMESTGLKNLLDRPTDIIKSKQDMPGTQEVENAACFIQPAGANAGAVLLHEFIAFQFQRQFHSDLLKIKPCTFYSFTDGI